MVVRTFEQLAAYFEAERISHRIDRERRLVELLGYSASLPGQLVIRWGDPFVQLVHAVIEGVPDNRVRDVAIAIALLDDRLEMGGFGWSSATSSIYFRLSIPVFPSDGLNANVLATLRQGVVANASEFAKALQQVVDGAPGEQILELYEATRATPSSGSDA